MTTGRDGLRSWWSRGIAAVLLLAGAMLLSGAVEVLAVEDEEDSEGPSLAISNARIDDYPIVRLTVNASGGVIDPDGVEDAVTLLEDGEQRDVAVQRLDSEDLEVALIVDTSGSMEGAPLAVAQEAALEFLATMPEVVRVAVIEFDTTAALTSDFTDDRAASSEALTGLTAGGWTAMYDAVELALDLFEERGTDRRAIVLLTDGGDNRSATTLDALTARLADGDDVLHIVELITADRPVPRERFGRDDPAIDEIDLEALNSLAAAANQGFVASPTDLDAVSDVYADIAASLTHQYELTYTSASYDVATVLVRLSQDGSEIEGTRDIELPPAPDEPEDIEEAPEPEPEPDEEEPPPPEDEQELAVVAESEPSETDLLGEPWVLYTTVIALLLGAGFLVYYIRNMLSWRT